MSERKLAEILTSDEELALLNQFNSRYPAPARNRAMVLVALNTGARIADLVNMRWEDLTIDSGKWHIKQGKGKKDRVVFIKPGVIDELIKLAEQTDRERKGNIFVTRDGGPVQCQYLRNMIRDRASKAGISKRVHFHLLRHTYLSNLYSRTKDIRLIQEIAGHASIQTTMVYTHISGEDVRLAMLGEPELTKPEPKPKLSKKKI